MFTQTLCTVVTCATLAAPVPVAAEDGLVIQSAGLESMLVDEKDRVLLEALQLIDERVMDLPAELDEEEIPAPLFRSALEMLSSPLTFQLGVDRNIDSEIPLYATLSIRPPSQQAARDMELTLSQIVSNLPVQHTVQEAIEPDQLNTVELEDGSLYFGTKNLDDTPTVILSLNREETEPANLGRLGLPENVSSVLSFRFDAKKIQPLIDQMLATTSKEEAKSARQQLALMGLAGENPLAITTAFGYDDDRVHIVQRYINYAASPTNAAMLTGKTLSSQHLQLIPRDATVAQLSLVKWSGLTELLEQINRTEAADVDLGEGDDPIEQIEAMTGVHLKHDLLDHIGELSGFYMSETTGGGGWTSLITFVEVTNEPGLRATLDRLSDMLSQAANREADGYFRIRTRSYQKQKITSILFPGLPVPLELSYTIEEGYLWLGLSPQAVIAAIDHTRTDGRSLPDNPQFKEVTGETIDDAIALTFTNTPHLAKQCYGLMSLGMAALSNAVRSPGDAGRGLSLTMPSYHELMRNVKASLSITHRDGDDLIVTTQGDRSVLVQLSALAGVFVPW